MKPVGTAWIALLCLLSGSMARAASPVTITDPAAPLVKQLELRYARSIAIARTGDVEAYFAHRTAASRKRPPALDSARLKLLADLLPPLEMMQFVRLDSTATTARALYRWRRQDVAQYTIIVFRIEKGDWKIDDFSVRRSGLAGEAERGRPPAAVPRRNETPPSPALALDGPRL
jgi:hypothetical protein